MLEIALNESGNGVFQKDIANRQKISLKYLDAIIASLKASGLILNIRGRKSGYRLSRKSSEIKLIDIYKAFEPGISIVDCMDEKYDCTLAGTCAVKEFWKGLNDQIETYFISFTLEDLILMHKKKSKSRL